MAGNETQAPTEARSTAEATDSALNDGRSSRDSVGPADRKADPPDDQERDRGTRGAGVLVDSTVDPAAGRDSDRNARDGDMFASSTDDAADVRVSGRGARARRESGVRTGDAADVRESGRSARARREPADRMGDAAGRRAVDRGVRDQGESADRTVDEAGGRECDRGSREPGVSADWAGDPVAGRKADGSARERGLSTDPTPGIPEPPPSAFRRMRLWAVAHAVDDLYQGLVPATVPYFVLDRGYSYVAASGLTLAATLGSSLPQPLLGVFVDRTRATWPAAAGVAAAGIGLGLSGLVQSYAAVWVLILVSGLGVAMFHPAAGKAAREEAGDSTAAMSVFAAGGSVGFFLAPVLATPALMAWGVGATALFIPPAVIVAYVLFRGRHRRNALAAAARGSRTGADRWGPFLVLTALAVVRSATFFGVSTFLGLYWIRHLGASDAVGGVALACFLGGGVVGTLLGGRLADRIGAVRAVQVGGVLVIPMLVGLRLLPGPYAPLALALLTGVALNIPFAVLVKLGQDYLPNRPGTAAGVTLGLAVSVGGLAAPVLGAVADAHGPEAVFTVLCFVPAAAVALGFLLREPATARS